MNRHRPQDVHAEAVQLVEFGGDAVEVAGHGKIARKNFVNGAAAEPVGRRRAVMPETSTSAQTRIETKTSAAANVTEIFLKG